MDGAFDLPVGPEARYEQTESISLAFVAALVAAGYFRMTTLCIPMTA
jgi:hypothetical protein